MDDEIEIIFDGSEVRDYWDYLKSVWRFFIITESFQSNCIAFYWFVHS